MVTALKVVARDDSIKKYRARMKLTQKDVAELVGLFLAKNISEATYKKWETGARPVDLATAKVISRVLEFPLGSGFKSADKRIAFGADL